MEGLEKILQKLDPSVPVSITESCGDLLLQDLIEMFQEDAVMERTNLIASSVTSEKPKSKWKNIEIPVPSRAAHNKEYASGNLKEYFQQMDEKKIRLYRRIVRCLLYPAIPTKSTTAKSSSKQLMANDPSFKEFIINHVILNCRNGLGISNWVKTVEKRFCGLNKVGSLQSSLKSLIGSNNKSAFKVSSFLSVPGNKLAIMRSSTSALPGPDQSQRLYSEDQGHDLKLQKEEAGLYLEDIKKFLQVQVELLTPKRENLELPVMEIRSKLSEFLDQFLNLIIKWMEKDNGGGKMSGSEKDDKICFILLGVDKKSIPYQRQHKETAAVTVSLNDETLKELQLIHPNLHDQIIDLEESTSSYETVLFDLQLTISSREHLPFYETEIQTRAFSLFKMENDLAIAEMRRFIMQHKVGSKSLSDRFVARLCFRIVKPGTHGFDSDDFLEFIYEKQAVKLKVKTSNSKSIEEGYEVAMVYLTGKTPPSKLKIRLWEKPCNKSPIFTRRSQSSMSLKSVSKTSISSTLKGTVKDIGISLGIRKVDANWIKMKVQLLPSDIQQVHDTCSKQDDSRCLLYCDFGNTGGAGDYGKVTIKPNDDMDNTALNGIVLSCELVQPQPPIPTSMVYDYHKVFAFLMEDLMRQDCKYFLRLYHHQCGKSDRLSYRPWRAVDGSRFLMDFGIRYGVGTLFRLLTAWRIYYNVLYSQKALNVLKTDYLYVKNNLINPITLIIEECGTSTFSDHEKIIFEDLTLTTEKQVIESISKLLKDNVIMQGSNLELNSALDVLKSLYECKRLGLPTSASQTQVSFSKLVHGIFQSSALTIYEKISTHVATFASSCSNFTRLIRIQEFIHVYLKAICHVKVTVQGVTDLICVYTATMYSRWIEEIDRLPWKLSSNSEWSVDAFQLLHNIQNVVKVTQETSDVRLSIQGNVFRFLLLNWLKCIEQDGFQFTIEIVNQDRLCRSDEMNGTSSSLVILRKFQKQTLNWLLMMRADLEQLQSSSWDDVLSEYAICMERIFKYYKSWMEQSLDLLVMGLERTGVLKITDFHEDIPEEIPVILCNINELQKFRNDLIHLTSQYGVGGDAEDLEVESKKWLDESIEHITSFFCRKWMKWLDSELITVSLTGLESKNSSASSILGLLRKPKLSSKQVEPKNIFHSLKWHERLHSDWSIFHHVTKPIEKMCSVSLSAHFQRRLFENCCNTLLFVFIRVCDSKLKECILDAAGNISMVIPEGLVHGLGIQGSPMFGFGTGCKIPVSNGSHDQNAREELALQMEMYYHRLVQHVMDIFQSLQEFFRLDLSSRQDWCESITLLTRLPQESSSSGADLVNFLYRNKGNSMKVRLYSLLVRYKALHVTEKECVDCVRCMALGRDFDSSYEQQEKQRLLDLEKSRDQWSNVEL